MSAWGPRLPRPATAGPRARTPRRRRSGVCRGRLSRLRPHRNQLRRLQSGQSPVAIESRARASDPSDDAAEAVRLVADELELRATLRRSPRDRHRASRTRLARPRTGTGSTACARPFGSSPRAPPGSNAPARWSIWERRYGAPESAAKRARRFSRGWTRREPVARTRSPSRRATNSMPPAPDLAASVCTDPTH